MRRVIICGCNNASAPVISKARVFKGEYATSKYLRNDFIFARWIGAGYYRP